VLLGVGALVNLANTYQLAELVSSADSLFSTKDGCVAYMAIEISEAAIVCPLCDFASLFIHKTMKAGTFLELEFHNLFLLK